MANNTPHSSVRGLTAEFDSVDTLLAACRRVRDAGYTRTDAFTPFPVHGIDKALGIRPTVLPWIAFVGGLIGCLSGLAMEIWMNGINYQYIISGKPFISLPAFIPVAFELTILLASFGSFFGMLALNKLPRFSNPLFTNPRFDRATDDRFFLYIDAQDDRFEIEGAKTLLSDCGSKFVEPVVEDESSTAIPRGVFYVLTALAIVALLPPILIARMRVTHSDSPRFHIMYDMDFSPAKDPQTRTTLFADGRAMRPDVPGTVARGQLEYGLDFNTGIDMQALAALDPQRAKQFVASSQPPADEQPADEPPADEPPADEPPADEPPADEPPADEPPADEPPADEPPADEPPADEPPADEPPADEPAEMEPETSAVNEPAQADGAPADAPAQAGDGAAAVDNTPWLTENPLPITMANLERGQQQFNIYCAVCHGRDGSGSGLVARRAQRILSTTWVPPTKLYNLDLNQQQYPDGKLFNTITHGIRKMPGYASQINANDRWAVVAYVRALQASRNADELAELVPADRRDELQGLQQVVKEALEKEAQRAAEAAQKSAEGTTPTTLQNS